MIKVLFVCMGNICRSPAAEGITRSKLEELGLKEGEDFSVDSAGTNGIVGSQPDVRSQHVCQMHGIDISKHIGRKLTKDDGQDFDYIFCMDAGNLAIARHIISNENHHKLRQISKEGVGDPYQLGSEGFAIMYSQLDEATDEIIRVIVS